MLQASNPGNFDNDCDYAWLKGTNPEVVYHHVSVCVSVCVCAYAKISSVKFLAKINFNNVIVVLSKTYVELVFRPLLSFFFRCSMLTGLEKK